MRKLVIDSSLSQMRIDKALKEAFPDAPSGAIYKALRKRDVKANGKRIKEDYKTIDGDVLEIYITDEILEGAIKNDYQPNKGFSVVYEDRNIIIVNKEQGIPVHPDREQSTGTLIDLIRSYLEQKGEYGQGPALCHRLDRNTGGLVLIAKNPQTLDIILDKIKKGEIKKLYQCLAAGEFENPSGELRAFLEKDERKSRVFINSEKKPGSLEILTRYKVLSYDLGISRLEIELLTGRTHQIRAHLAFIGHPVIGDGKYGTNELNRRYGMKRQALWAYKIIFDFKGNSGHLDYLKGKKFEVTPGFYDITKTFQK